MASKAITKHSAIHSLTEIDVTEPRRLIHKIQEKGGPKISFTASFDHEIVDGAPAARFMKQFSEMVEGGSLLDAKEVNG